MEIEQVINKREAYTKYFTEYVAKLRERSGNKHLQEFAQLRDFQLQTILDSEIFYIDEMTEMLLPDFFSDVESFGVISETNNKPIFNHRWVIPIRTTSGLVDNLVGYSNVADERYIYGTAQYYRRRDTLYGLENLKLAYEMGYAFLTEGITDTIRLRDLGFKNSFAMCGTHKSAFIIQQLKRCRYGIIKIPDRDDAGLRALKGWESFRSITVMISMMYKDIDEMCKNNDENKIWVKQFLNDCINWIKQREHQGKQCLSEVVTMI